MALRKIGRALLMSAAVVPCALAVAGDVSHSVARQWNDALLDAIRKDFARPTVHARNLYHTSAAMWDAWAAYDCTAQSVLVEENATAKDIEAAREEAISYAMFRLLNHRFANSPGAAISLPLFHDKMVELGYDPNDTTTVGNTPAAVGNRIASGIIAFGLTDGANEAGGYANQVYAPVNPALVVSLPGNPDIIHPNRWQPLALDFFIDQSGNVIPFGFPPALSPEWGIVTPFSMEEEDLTIYQRDNFDWWVYHDPGPPPYLGGVGDAAFKAGFERVIEYSSVLDPSDGSMIDISPASRGNSTLGTNDGTGYATNPATGQPYQPQVVPAGDYYRILAEFWADGPASETPPGHWNTIANYVSDHPQLEKRLGGTGPIVSDLEWDVKLYLALNGTMHDVAIAAWGVKGWYDYVRPVSAIRYMCSLGQCTDPNMPSFHPSGVNLQAGLIELVTAESTAPGERHEHLAGAENIGKIAIRAWKGPDYITDPDTDVAGVGWILAENWWPYQRPTFVSPPFPGYVSGHSTYSRAAAELMSRFTGSEYFPGGIGEFHAPQNDFLVFERGPSVDVTLQWARYADAADECSLSRIYGGIHPPQDDIPGRFMGAAIAPDAYDRAVEYYNGYFDFCPGDVTGDKIVDFTDLNSILVGFGVQDPLCAPTDLNNDLVTDFMDLNVVITLFGTNCVDD